MSRHDDPEATEASATLVTSAAGPPPTDGLAGYTDMHPIGSGGMGVVYAARDVDGRRVAIKRLPKDQASASARKRFAREADVLRTLSHSALVEHVAHGEAADGDPFLVMEWLEGEDLGVTLQRGALSQDDTLALARRVADGLAAAHAAGVVHRDIKPSNVFLPGGDPEHAKVIDFGVARWRQESQALTRTGGIVGTPGYMSPEQARGDATLDERTDIYSLGCVVYECLAGRPPFSGTHAIAVLAKILLEDPEPLSTLRPDVSPALAALVEAMMARDPAARLPTMADVVARLDDAPSHPRARVSPVTRAIGRGERRFVTVLVMSGPASDPPRAEITAQYGGIALGHAEVGHVVVFESGGAPADIAASAARCALHLRDAHSPPALAIVSGRAELSGGSIVGDVLGRAASALGDGSSAAGGRVFAAPMTRELLDERFEVTDEGEVLGFSAERATARRTVLGRESPFVGRAREVAQISGVIAEAIEEDAPRAVIVTAGPGVGKSRLRFELLRRVRAEHEPCELIGRGDAVSDRVSFGLIARAVRSHAGISAGEAPDEQRRKLAGIVAEGPHAARTRVFLGELAGIPAADPIDPTLADARDDPALMRNAIRDAWVSWVASEVTGHPVVLVLEDLHWGDEATLDLIDHAFFRLPDAAFVVLALARPELDDRFEAFWTDHEVTRVSLNPLTEKAARRLVTKLAANELAAEVVERIVELAAGNAFFIEQLVRIAAAHRSTAGDLVLPDSVLATATARLDELEPRARRLLRVASVFGERFWSGGIQSLLADQSPQAIQATVEDAVRAEHLVARPTSAVAGHREFQFAHALVRDAAYASLTESDRAAAHSVVARWLVAHASPEAFVVADHHRRAGESKLAAAAYVSAASQSIDAFDHGGALEHAAAGLDQDDGELRTELLALRMTAQVYLGQHELAIATAAEFFDDLDPSSSRFWQLESLRLEAHGRHGRFDFVRDRLDEDLESRPQDDDLFEPWLAACARGTMHLGKGRGGRVAGPYFERLAAAVGERELGLNARLRLLLVEQELADQIGNLGVTYRNVEEIQRLEARQAGVPEEEFPTLAGHVTAQLGLHARSETDFLGDLAFAGAHGMQHLAFVANGMLANLALRGERFDDAEGYFAEAMRYPTTDPRMLGPVTGMRGQLALARGDLDAALEDAMQAERFLSQAPALHPWGQCVLASVLRALGRVDDALELTRQGVTRWEELGGLSEFEGFVLGEHLACLEAAGLLDEARARADEFRARMEQRCRWIGDEALERSFLAVPDNARLMTLVEKLGTSS